MLLYLCFILSPVVDCGLLWETLVWEVSMVTSTLQRIVGACGLFPIFLKFYKGPIFTHYIFLSCLFMSQEKTFGRTFKERQLTFEEKKRNLIENARQRYLEKNSMIA